MSVEDKEANDNNERIKFFLIGLTILVAVGFGLYAIITVSWDFRLMDALLEKHEESLARFEQSNRTSIADAVVTLQITYDYGNSNIYLIDLVDYRTQKTIQVFHDVFKDCKCATDYHIEKKDNQTIVTLRWGVIEKGNLEDYNESI
jgi:hypothetical protein